MHHIFQLIYLDEISKWSVFLPAFCAPHVSPDTYWKLHFPRGNKKNEQNSSVHRQKALLMFQKAADFLGYGVRIEKKYSSLIWTLHQRCHKFDPSKGAVINEHLKGVGARIGWFDRQQGQFPIFALFSLEKMHLRCKYTYPGFETRNF